ncbi:uncharacterized protein LOC109714668 [Ananas comosus]|uniref:Uncharacterized protein LOC109714668 n=1 Tax=Ananas comosus TaxID=4615 RepID=A0A199V3B5_ANACO|nr:uncharacterized protein LOC109714668 [Ananas comosus]OAY71577.1 hypothetical protein ACMD2_08508 [Ananas comosus]
MVRPNLSPLDLKLFHKQERDFFHRLVVQLGQDQDRIKWVMALWLWFESIGHHEFIRHVSAYRDDDVVRRFLAEAWACLSRLSGRPIDPAQVDDQLPSTNSLISEPVDLRFFEYHKSEAAAGVRYFFDNVCEVIFDDELMERVARDAERPDNVHAMSSGFGEGTSSTPIGSRLSVLNPMARPWAPGLNHSPEDQRSMFITFSRGYPISREDIAEFFNSRYGPCVEVVMIERAPPGQPPMYGRLVFTSASMVAVVLNGQRTAKFVIKGKHLWARMYVPRYS